MARLRLQIRMIPKPLYGKNLRIAVGQYRWRKLRQSLLPNRLVCECCGASVQMSSELNAHEEWAYSVRRNRSVAKLERISFQCVRCHGCEHFGRTLLLVRQGYLTSDQVEETIDHFCAVNRVSRRDFERHLQQAMKRWHVLSKRKRWTVDYGTFASVLAERQAWKNREPVKLRLHPARDSEIATPTPWPRRGRPPLFGRAMTKAEIRARHRYFQLHRGPR